MTEALGHLDHTSTYFDDIVVHTKKNTKGATAQVCVRLTWLDHLHHSSACWHATSGLRHISVSFLRAPYASLDLSTDFSKDGLAAILSQVTTPGVEVPVQLASRATRPEEQILGAMEGELAAILQPG